MDNDNDDVCQSSEPNAVASAFNRDCSNLSVEWGRLLFVDYVETAKMLDSVTSWVRTKSKEYRVP